MDRSLCTQPTQEREREQKQREIIRKFEKLKNLPRIRRIIMINDSTDSPHKRRSMDVMNSHCELAHVGCLVAQRKGAAPLNNLTSA